jgi:hypothetical protein
MFQVEALPEKSERKSDAEPPSRRQQDAGATPPRKAAGAAKTDRQPLTTDR